MNKFIEYPVFICGHPKAGTSLLTALLDGHPAIIAYPEETLFFRRFLPAIQGKSFEETLSLADQLLIHIFEWNPENPPEHQRNYPDRDYSDIAASEVKKVFQSYLIESEKTEKDYLEAAVYAFGAASGLVNSESQCWVEKTPYNELHDEQIFDWWPEAKCIHIIRDPRDNFVSYHRKQLDWSAKKFAWNWVRSTRDGLVNRMKFGPSRYMLIRFEDLLTDPEKITREIAEFLGIPWQVTMLQPTRVGKSWRGNSMFAEKFQKISVDPIGRWEGRIDLVDLALLQFIARKEMAALDYAFVKPELSGINVNKRLYLMYEKLITRGKQIRNSLKLS